MRLVLLVLIAFTGVARAQTPTDRAKAIIETQRALLDKDKAGAKALLTAMDPDAIVVSRMAVERAGRILELMAGKTINGIDETLARNALDPVFWTNWDPDATGARKATVKSTVSNLVAGGRADAVWFTFELAVDRTTVEAKPFKMTHKFRITELVVDKAGWKGTTRLGALHELRQLQAARHQPRRAHDLPSQAREGAPRRAVDDRARLERE
jgi:hypothetical protein